MFVTFSKYHGAGNDFIVIDDRAAFFPVENTPLIEHLCHRRFGIGGDGLLLLQSSKCADFRMRIFNSDGKEASMCGNGIRCLVHFLRSLGFKEEQFSIETMHATLACQIKGDRISVVLGKPHVLHWGVSLEDNGSSYVAYVVNTGVPHAVVFVEDLDDIDVFSLGRRIRNHSLFSPHGVNVNFAKIAPDGTVRIRTYERGVEDETYACGTGSAAVALTVAQTADMQSPIRLLTKSKEYLEINVKEAPDGGKEIEMIGNATYVFEGRIAINRTAHL